MDLHPTLEIIDSSKLATYMRCPRRFFIRHVMGFKVDRPEIHKDFGIAIHEGLEALYSSYQREEKHTEKGLAEAQLAFTRKYEERFRISFEKGDPDPNGPGKCWGDGLKMLQDYYQLYQNVDEFTVMDVEASGAIPLRRDRVLHFRLDLAAVDSFDQPIVMDHKTTGKLSRDWQKQYGLSLQVGSYQHFMFTTFGTAAGCMYFNVLVTPAKTRGPQYVRVPIPLREQMLEQALFDINSWYDQLERDLNKVADATAEDKVLKAFPRNPESCRLCDHTELCLDYTNFIWEKPPLGYKIEFWDPRVLDKNFNKETQSYE